MQHKLALGAVVQHGESTVQLDVPGGLVERTWPGLLHTISD